MYSDFDGYVTARGYRTKPEWIIDLTRYGDGAEASWKASRKQKTIREQDRYADGKKAEEMAGAVLFWLHGQGNHWPDTRHDVRPAIEHIKAALAGGAIE
jgi:hypothetical protein